MPSLRNTESNRQLLQEVDGALDLLTMRYSQDGRHFLAGLTESARVLILKAIATITEETGA